MIIPSGALFDRFGSFRIAAGVEAQPVFGIVDKSGAVSDLTGRSILWRFLDAHNVVVGTPIAATVNGATATFAFTGALTESLRTGGVAGFEIAMLTATGRVVLHRGAASIDDAAPFLGGVAGAPGTDSLTILAATGTLIISAQGAPGSSTEALAAAALANGAAAAAQDRTTFADAAGRAANAAAVDSVAKTALAVTATGDANTATAAAKAATADSVAKTALTVTATAAATAGATAANTAAAQIVPEGGPSLLIKPGTGTFPAIADAYFAGRKSLYSSFDGLRRQLRGFADVTDFSRATAANYFDATGALQTAPSGIARLGYRFNTTSSTWVLAGLLIEGQATNLVANSTGTGAVAGTPGTDPTGWSVSTSWGLTKQLVGTGSQNGVEYVDYRFSGVATTTAGQIFRLETYGTGNIGDVYAESVFLALVGGSWAGIGATPIQLRHNSSDTVASITPTATLTRFSGSGALATAQTGISLRIAALDTTTAIDFTLRIGLPQRETGTLVSSPIKTAGAQATRAADSFSKALGVEFNPASQTALMSLYTGLDTTGDRTIFAWGGVSDNLRLFYRATTNTIFLLATYGGVQSAINGPVVAKDTLVRIAIGFSGKMIRLVVNGVAFPDVTNTNTGPAPVFNSRVIGGSSAISYVNSFILPYLPHPTNPLLDATEFPRLLSVAEMQGYTA